MLTPMKKRKAYALPIIAVDTEDDSSGHVTLIDFCWRGPDGKAWHKTFTQPVLARQWIRLKKRNCIFVAHNLEYDLCNLFRDQEFTDIARLSYTSRLISAEMLNSKAIWLDSFNFFPSSLAAMAKTVGMKKGELDIHSLEYVRGDTEILLTFVEQFQKKVVEELEVNLTPTIGGLSMRVFRTSFLDKEYEQFNKPLALSAYYGGRCELFFRGEIDNIHYADVNSMYPDAMLSDFPDCEYLQTMSRWDEFPHGIADVTVHVPEDTFVPPLPGRTPEGRLVFPVGTFRGVWTLPEIQHAIRECKVSVLDFHEGYGTSRTVRPFDSYINHFYEKRKQSVNDFERTFFKLFLNNLYGKMAAHNPRKEARTSPMDEKEQEKLNAVLVQTLGKFYVYEIQSDEPPPTANWIWGSYITSYARIKLHKGLLSAHRNNCKLIYCDTDSIFWKGSPNPPGLELNASKLGAWKVEHFASGDFMIPKGYILREHDTVISWDYDTTPGVEYLESEYTIKGKAKIACKGVPIPKALNPELMETEENPAWAFLKCGFAEVRKPTRLRAALARDLTPGAWLPTPKTRKTEYERRQTMGDGTTYPLVLGGKYEDTPAILRPKKKKVSGA